MPFDLVCNALTGTPPKEFSSLTYYNKLYKEGIHRFYQADAILEGFAGSIEHGQKLYKG